MISVIMPVYNTEEYLAEAIESVLNQTYGDFEFIIINDGSVDSSLEIIEDYMRQDGRIVCINKENGGVASALNEGLRAAKGKYIVRMDSDDVSYPDRFEKLVSFMEKNSQVDICGSWALENGKKIMKTPVNNEEIKLYMLFFSPFIHPTVIIRKSFLDKNKLEYNRVVAEDYDLWVRCVNIATFANIPEGLLMYRVHNKNVSAKNNEKFMPDDLRIKQLYCEIQGVTKSVTAHFMDTDFSEKNLEEYELVLKEIIKKYNLSKMPELIFRRLVILYIEVLTSLNDVYVRYKQYTKLTSLIFELKHKIYIVLKYILIKR